MLSICQASVKRIVNDSLHGDKTELQQKCFQLLSLQSDHIEYDKIIFDKVLLIFRNEEVNGFQI